MFTVHSSRKGQAAKDAENRISMRLYLYGGAYSTILGVGVFFMRYLGVQGIGLGTCLVNCYGGVVLATAFFRLSAPAEEQAAQATLPRGDWRRVVGLSCSVLVTMSAAF